MLAVSPGHNLALPSYSLDDMDESGTINPAALNAASANTIAPSLLTQSSPRGVKRGRSDDGNNLQGLLAIGDESKSNKRSRGYENEDMLSHPMLAPVQTPQTKPESLPQTSPNQGSPQRTPGSASKPAVVKALPTVRDHTTDQLNDERDEYNYRETDPDGELKVSKDGYPMDSRKYKCRTFQVPKRGEKLFMLATECARVLGYRDSYLLFNKNRSLYKIIANQEEKDNLIHQEILPFSYRSRQIAIVTARSMFRQFGSRLIDGGRRVRDDYWEAKARKQGFTEEDAAGEKRPGAAKAREAQAAAEASHASQLASIPQSEIIYNTNGLDGQPPGLMHQPNLTPLPMIHLASDDLRSSAYGNVIRPRQELAGPPYHDRTQSSSGAEIMTQASSAAEWNKQLAVTRQHRTQYLDDYWRRPHEQPQTTQAENDVGTVTPQNLTSPQAMPGSQQRLQQHDQMHNSQMLSQMYSGYSNPHAQNPMASPVQGMHRALPPGQMHQGSPGMPSAARQNQAYGYAGNQMWPQSQASSMSQNHAMPQYGQQHHSQMPPPHMASQAGMNYGQMNTMANPAYAGMNRTMYQQQNPNSQQFNMQQNAAQQQGMQGWNTPGMSQYGQGF